MATIKVSIKDVVENKLKPYKAKVFYNDLELDGVMGVYPQGDKLTLEFVIKKEKPPKDYEVEYEV